MSARVTVLAVVCLALLAGGCGSGSATQATDGRAIFIEADCGGCHVLKDAGGKGHVGPDLDQARPDADTVRNKVRTGGGAMPAFGSRLDDQQIDAVAEYVARVAGR